ncbi:TRAP transporter small permease [Castellaniella sp.]|uniref:TRAP transporter small permease n=1 Tax=Castellaniella sp. TaxID=1955812 RepID=UPI002D80C49E|nr:TRAP transporter small permease [Castellaniella sp.]HET8703028.1 TRAP transporter small permease [Castellaniella sp.]
MPSRWEPPSKASRRMPPRQRAAHLIARGFEIMIVACLTIMGILVFGNVVLRYAFNSGIAISEELSRLLFVWLIFMGAVLASARRIHIGFDTLQRAVGPRTRRALVVFTGALILVGCGIFIVGGWRQTSINLGNTYPVLGISYAWLYGTALVFGVALIFPVCNNIRRALAGIDDGLTEDLADRIESLAERIEDEPGHPSAPAGRGAADSKEGRP